MKHIGLFEGIGGFSLAARWMGWKTVAYCEWDEFCQRVLKYHFPNAEAHGDITKTDFSCYAQKVDIITAGFPCQPFSTAGKRLGSDDDRHLWPATLRAVKQAKPGVCVFENVFGLTSILESACESEMEIQAVHLFSEGDDSEQVGERIREVKQRTISIIINDLREAGYTLPETSTGDAIILCIPACAVNAPHRRDRVWIVAFNTKQVANGRHNGGTSNGERMGMERNSMVSSGREQGTDDFGASISDVTHPRQTEHTRRNEPTQGQQYDGGRDARSEFAPFGGSFDATNAAQTERKQPSGTWPGREGLADLCPGQFDTNTRNTRQERGKLNGTPDKGNGREQPSGSTTELYQIGDWQQFPTKPPVCSRNDGISDGLVGITFSKHREKSIGAYGNAIVPQVALQIFKAIQEYEL